MSLDSTPAEEVRTPTVGCPQPGGKSVYASLGLGTGLRFRICSGGLASTVAVKHYVGAYVPGGFRLEHTECTGIYFTSRPLDLRPPMTKSQISNQTFLAAALLKLGVLNEAHMSEQAGAYKTRLGGMAMACDKQCNTVVCKAFCDQVANPETPHNGRSGCAILGMRFPEQAGNMYEQFHICLPKNYQQHKEETQGRQFKEGPAPTRRHQPEVPNLKAVKPMPETRSPKSYTRHRTSQSLHPNPET